VVEQETADRATIIDWAVATDPVLTTADRDQVVRVYARILRDRRQPGDWLQNEDGTWVQVPGAR
jgi:hypothetical protein